MTPLRQILGNALRRVRLLGRTDDAAALGRLFWLLQRQKFQPGVIQWHGRALHYADAPALYHQLSDIYVERNYDFACDRPDPRILDVGGHIGLASLRFHELFSAARITTFEPDPQLVPWLRANLAGATAGSIEIVAAAAWTSDGVQSFNATGDDSGALSGKGRIRVNTVELARYCNEPVDFLKLDVEGAEFDLIRHLASTGVLRQVRRLFVELHEWNAGPPRFHEALTALAQAGFNYRLRSAAVLGNEAQPAGFTTLAHPANLVALVAWRT